MAFRKFFKLPKKNNEEKEEPVKDVTIILIGDRQSRETLLRLMMLPQSILRSCIWNSYGNGKEISAKLISMNNLEKCVQLPQQLLAADNVFLYCPKNSDECVQWLRKFQPQLQENINQFIVSNDADVRRVGEERDLIVFPYPRNTEEAAGVLSEIKQWYLAFRELIPSNKKKLIDIVKAPRVG